MRLSTKTIKQIFFFGIVGVISLVIDVAVTRFLYQALGVPVAIASTIGFFSAFAFNFPVNRKKVFHHTENDRYSLKIQIFLYSALLLLNAIFTALSAAFLVHVGFDITLVKILLTAVIAVWNFILFRSVIFSKKE